MDFAQGSLLFPEGDVSSSPRGLQQRELRAQPDTQPCGRWHVPSWHMPEWDTDCVPVSYALLLNVRAQETGKVVKHGSRYSIIHLQSRRAQLQHRWVLQLSFSCFLNMLLPRCWAHVQCRNKTRKINITRALSSGWFPLLFFHKPKTPSGGKVRTASWAHVFLEVTFKRICANETESL